MSLPLYALVVVTLLLPLVAPAVAVAQPAPSQCPEGQVLLPDQNICVPDPEAPPDDAGDGAESPVEPTADAGLPVEPTAEDGDDAGEPTEPPADDGDDAGEPTEPPADDGATIRSLLLEHYACDAVFDPQVRVGDRDAACTGAGKPAFTYTITVDGQIVSTVTMQTGDGTRGTVELESTPEQPVPAGPMIISVEPVAGWAPGYLFCDIFRPNGEARTIEPDVRDGTLELTTESGDLVRCEWYHVETGTGNAGGGEGVDLGEGQGVFADPPEATGADITIATYSCPAGTVATADLVATCTQRASGLTFSLLTAAETAATQVSDAEGDIFFAGVPANDYGIAATLPAGYGEPIVLCYVADPSGNVFEGQRDVVFGNQIRLRLGDGFSAECAWYNVPAQGPENGPNVFIQARKCGEGIEITPAMTVFEAEQLCPVVYQNKEFLVLFDEAPITTKVTNDDPLSSGQVFFTRLQAPNGGGVYGVRTTLLEGEQTLGVFCDQNYGGEVFRTVTTTVTDGNRIDQELLEGYTLRCSWFIEINPLAVGTQVASQTPELDPTSMAATEQAMLGTVAATQTELDPTTEAAQTAMAAAATVEAEIAAAEPHTLTIQFWTCPAGTDPAGDQVDLVQACGTDTEVRAFTLAVDGDTMGQTVTGSATWEFLDPTIAADLGPGLASSAWCTSEWAEVGEDTIDIPDSVALEGGLLTVTVSRPQTAVYCDWYLFPG